MGSPWKLTDTKFRKLSPWQLRKGKAHATPWVRLCSRTYLWLWKAKANQTHAIQTPSSTGCCCLSLLLRRYSPTSESARFSRMKGSGKKSLKSNRYPCSAENDNLFILGVAVRDPEGFAYPLQSSRSSLFITSSSYFDSSPPDDSSDIVRRWFLNRIQLISCWSTLILLRESECSFRLEFEFDWTEWIPTETAISCLALHVLAQHKNTGSISYST